jgi:hypothetical protein
MRNRYSRAFYAMASTVAVTTVVGLTAAGAASASTTRAKPDITPPCGSDCITIFNEKYGPDFVLDNHKTRRRVGNKLELFPASNSDSAEDFVPVDEGTVDDFYDIGLVSSKLAFNYGDDTAYMLEWAPYGVETGLCEGTAGDAKNNEKVSLQACGQNAKTVWVVDSEDADPNTGLEPQIAGTDTNFSDPQVLTTGGSPFLPSQPQLKTYRMKSFADGEVYTTQLWFDPTVDSSELVS